jgi:4-hydroxythreonine-4-phosphate dehydrogenase
MPISQPVRPSLALTLGDPGGIGPEVLLKSLQSFKTHELSSFVIVAPFRFIEKEMKRLRLRFNLRILYPNDPVFTQTGFLSVLDFPSKYSAVKVGKIASSNAHIALSSLGKATELCLRKHVRGMVTAPLSKASIQRIESRFIGHTEFLAKACGVDRFAMMLVGEPLRVTLVTIHTALQDVPRFITTQNVYEKIMLTHEYLKTFFKIRSPRIAVAALNPHGGEQEAFGKEEKRAITPAILKAKKRGVRVCGPVSGDRIFYEAYHGQHNAIVAMYHDQGLGPLKMIAFERGVNLTLGLPFVRTSPDHGTAFDIAGKNSADPSSMTEAIYVARRLVKT